MRLDTPRLALGLALLVVPLAACGGDDDGGSSSDTTSGGGGDSAEVVEVEASDSLEFDSDAYTATRNADGEVAFHYSGGNIPHTLLVEGHEDDMRLEISGDDDEGAIALEPGDYVIYCDVAGHRSAGMQATLTVE